MAEPYKQRRRSRRYTSAEFKPYVTALGQLALAWNDLQEHLASLFWTVMMDGPPREGDTYNYKALWAWHAIKSDRSQRAMLKGVVSHLPSDWGRPKLQEDVKWLLDRAEELEDWRNDAIHSPLFNVERSLFGMDIIDPKEKILPARWLLNPRATKLAKRQYLLGEFRYCRDLAITLADYAHWMERALINPKRPWPDRPALPTRQPNPPTRRQSRQKSAVPPPPPSRA